MEPTERGTGVGVGVGLGAAEADGSEVPSPLAVGPGFEKKLQPASIAEAAISPRRVEEDRRVGIGRL